MFMMNSFFFSFFIDRTPLWSELRSHKAVKSNAKITKIYFAPPEPVPNKDKAF